jgi:hypothetical protein
LIIGSEKTNLAYNEAIIDFFSPIPKLDYHIIFPRLGFGNKVSLAYITAALGLEYD